MKILDIRTLRGPNYWSIRRHHLIQMTLDLEELEEIEEVEEDLEELEATAEDSEEE